MRYARYQGGIVRFPDRESLLRWIGEQPYEDRIPVLASDPDVRRAKAYDRRCRERHEIPDCHGIIDGDEVSCPECGRDLIDGYRCPACD